MTSLTINNEALVNNTNIIKKLSDTSEVIAVVKGNAYGLGLRSFAKLLEQNGIRYFAVTDLNEAIDLRESGIKGEILMLTPLYNDADLHQAIIQRITLSITSKACGVAAENIAAKLRLPVHAHLCIDTGFGRYGFLDSKTAEIIETVQLMEHIQTTGIFSHFYGAGCKDTKHVYKQYNRFLTVCDTLTNAGISIGMRHIAATTSFLRFPFTKLDAIRIGSGFLGRLALADKWGFMPICKLEANISDIYTLPKGHNVGYGNGYTTSRTTTIAVVSAGYYHGLSVERQTIPYSRRFTPISMLRALKHQITRKELTATVGTHQFPVIGKIGMNSLILDITGYSLSVGEKVTFSINPIYVNSSIPRIYSEYCSNSTLYNSVKEETTEEFPLLKVI